jgi:LacI family transcriptional regulator
MAAAAISVAHRRGLDVPGDLSIVGFDDTTTATTIWPELTTIRQPIVEMANVAITLLSRILRGRIEHGTSALVDHVVPHKLIERDSAGPPRSRRC